MPIRFIAALTLSLLSLSASAGTPASAATAAPREVVATGIVPDEASRSAILTRLRDLYGAAAVVDRLEVGGVVPPPNWTEYMGKLLAAPLKQVHGGQLQVNGTQVALKGTVANEAQRQQIVSAMATALNPTYTIDNALVVGANAQSQLDQALSGRVIEFEVGSATLTPAGIAIVEEMEAAIRRLERPSVQIIGHTDSSGERMSNVVLSLSRANAVRDYLIRKGLPETSLSALGAGPDRPIASNDTLEGRAKNRRIEFRLAN
ncbi:OmpA family protein [Denitromonas iodatirespirans]|nr:OmpA family protein [Denitromonas iodatirespirans]